MPMGLNILPSIWQSYMNTILEFYKVELIVKQLWTTYYLYLFIIVHTFKKGTNDKIRRFIKRFTQEWS